MDPSRVHRPGFATNLGCRDVVLGRQAEHQRTWDIHTVVDRLHRLAAFGHELPLHDPSLAWTSRSATHL